MRLSGERVTLVPVPHEVAVAVAAHADPSAALAALGLQPGAGWPHADSADALRPHAEYGAGDAVGTFLITVRAVTIGECGWFGPPDGRGDTEIGYGLAEPSRGAGVGTEAVAALCAWVEQQPGVRRIAAEALVGNEPSRRLLRRLGFRESGGTPPYVRYLREPRHLDRTSVSG